MIDLRARLATATLPRRTVPVCLDGAALSALLDARAAGTDTTDLQAAVTTATDLWVLQALPGPVWTALLAKHPARPGNTADEAAGWNSATLPADLVRASVIDPADVIDDALWAQVMAVLTPAEVDKLAVVAFELTRIPVDLGPTGGPSN